MPTHLEVCAQHGVRRCLEMVALLMSSAERYMHAPIKAQDPSDNRMLLSNYLLV